jgi:hypothetical protein
MCLITLRKERKLQNYRDTVFCNILSTKKNDFPIPVVERPGSSDSRLQGFRVRIRPGAWISLMSVVSFWYRCLRRAYISCKGVLPTVVCHIVLRRNLKTEATLTRVVLLRQARKNGG